MEEQGSNRSILVDVGEVKSKAPTMVWVREVEVAFWLMLRNGRARLQPWWG